MVVNLKNYVEKSGEYKMKLDKMILCNVEVIRNLFVKIGATLYNDFLDDAVTMVRDIIDTKVRMSIDPKNFDDPDIMDEDAHRVSNLYEEAIKTLLNDTIKLTENANRQYFEEILRLITTEHDMCKILSLIIGVNVPSHLSEMDAMIALYSIIRCEIGEV